MRTPAVAFPHVFSTLSAIRCTVFAGSAPPLLLACLTLVLTFQTGDARAEPNPPRPRAPIFRCEGGGTATFSDSPQRCPTGQVSADMAAPGASGVTISPATSRISRSGAPCPLSVRQPDGPPWASLRTCFTRFLDTQPDHLVSESQLAGAAMGECDGETARLTNGKTFIEELGATPNERRQSIKVWAQWLVRSMGKAVDSVTVESVRAGHPVAISRLAGPLEQQWPDGSVTEAVSGTVVPPGNQLFVRRGVSFWVGGTAVAAQAKQDRCVKVD